MNCFFLRHPEDATIMKKGEMKSLRTGLGKHTPRAGKLPGNGLTLHDLGDLIRRAGVAAGFIVESEFKVPGVKGKHNAMKLDWVWLDPKQQVQPVVAFEIEGWGVDRRSIAADRRKFEACRARINIVALFCIDHDRTLKPRPPGNMNPYTWVKENLKGTSAVISVYQDYELMKRDGIEKIQRLAKKMMRR